MMTRSYHAQMARLSNRERLLLVDWGERPRNAGFDSQLIRGYICKVMN
jgi:hypothetical protein